MRWEIIYQETENGVYKNEFHNKMNEARAAFNKYYDSGCVYVELYDTDEMYDSVIYDGDYR